MNRLNPAAAANLAVGRAGLALFFSYLARSQGKTRSRVATVLLDDAVSALATTVMSPSLYEGFTGIAWACAHLSNGKHAGGTGGAGGDDPNAEVDEALLRYLDQSPWADHYDLMGGLVGLGVYALEQRPHPRADTMLARVLDRLAELARPTSGGLTWHTGPELLSSEQRAECPDGHEDLGVAHGVPGVIALLGLACQAGHALRAHPLLEPAVAWLLAQRLDLDVGAVFPAWTAAGSPQTPSRLAWCYGDAGVAATLLVAARGAGRSDWEAEALSIARRAAERLLDTTGIRDAGLCHGAAGLAHVFNRMYHTTGEEWLADASRCWFARTLDLRRPGEGLAGFLALRANASRQEWIAEPGLLTGVAGIGLALLGACTAVAPEWDRALLLSTPDAASLRSASG
jgi:hypothetical protein